MKLINILLCMSINIIFCIKLNVLFSEHMVGVPRTNLSREKLYLRKGKKFTYKNEAIFYANFMHTHA